MSVGGKYARYDSIINKISSKDVTENVGARLIIHVLEQAWSARMPAVKFDSAEIPVEMDAFFYGKSYKDDTRQASTQGQRIGWHFNEAFKLFMRELKDDIEGNVTGGTPFEEALLNTLYPTARTRTITSTKRNKNDTTLQSSYDTLSSGKVSTTYSDSFEPTKFLPINIDKSLLSLLLEKAHSAAVSATNPTSTNFFNTPSSSSVTDERMFYRKVGHPGKLFTKDGDKEIEVQKGSPEFMKLTEAGNCYTTGFKTDGTTKCYDLVQKCLAGTDIEKCKAYMRSPNWTFDEKINPDMAVELLSHFGVRTESVQNTEAGLVLKQFENVNSWLTFLESAYTTSTGGNGKLSTGDYKVIASNTALVGYLEALIAKVNRNPAILNPTYTGSNLTTNPNAFANTKFGKFGLQPKNVVIGSGVPSMSSIVALQNAVTSNRNMIAVYYGVAPVGFISGQRGGGIAEYLESVQDNNQIPLKLSALVNESFNSFIASLKNHGKDLDQGDYSHIQKLITDLKTNEDKLFKAAIYTDKYIRLLSVFGQSDNSSVLKMDHVEQFVDKRNNYFNKVGKKQDDLLSILKALAEATQTETKVETSSVTNYPKLVSKN
jgi:hypothetical protein